MKCKMAPKVVHQNRAYRRNFGENGEICDVNRFECQKVNYEIDYILLITYNNWMKLYRRMVHNKRRLKNKKNLLSGQQCQSLTSFKDFTINTLSASVDEINQLFRWEVMVDEQSYHLRHSEVTFLQPEQQNLRIIILNERGLEPRMLPWRPKFYQDRSYFPSNLLFVEFQ